MSNNHPNRAEPSLELTLARIKTRLARSAALDSSATSEAPPSFTPNPPLTQAHLAAWEAANGVLLPAAYQLFLLEIGNGGLMPSSYCDFVIRPLDTTTSQPSLREPFPITQAHYEQRLSQLPIEPNTSLFPDLSQFWEDGLPPGCLQLEHYPSFDRVLLVVTGELRGMVWNSVYDGLPELDQQGKPYDFLSWFEAALLDLSGPM